MLKIFPGQSEEKTFVLDMKEDEFIELASSCGFSDYFEATSDKGKLVKVYPHKIMPITLKETK